MARLGGQNKVSDLLGSKDPCPPPPPPQPGSAYGSVGSIHRHRRQHRPDFNASLTLKKEMEVGRLVHWNENLLQDLIFKDLVEWVTIFVSGKGTTQFLGPLKFTSGMGGDIGNAVAEALKKCGDLRSCRRAVIRYNRQQHR